jgi:ribosomal protein S18 acetylase RimI-like enzyme
MTPPKAKRFQGRESGVLSAMKVRGSNVKIIRVGPAHRGLLNALSLDMYTELPIPVKSIEKGRLTLDENIASKIVSFRKYKKRWWERWFPFLWNPRKRAADLIRERSKRKRESLKSGISLVFMAVAEVQGKLSVVGLQKCDVMKEDKSVHTHIKVDEGFQRLGIATEMIKRLHGVVEEWNSKDPGWEIHRLTGVKNKRMRNLLEKKELGYEYVGVSGDMAQYVKRFSERKK